VAVLAGYVDYPFIHKYVGKEDRQYYIEFAQVFTEGVEMIDKERIKQCVAQNHGSPS
jgi:hypothetical protein